MRHRDFTGVLVVALVPSWAGIAFAQPVVGVQDVGSACPKAAAVTSELTRLLANHRVRLSVRAALEVRVWDRGDRYRVRAADVERELVDPARRCAERARSAAVVAALAIVPPAMGLRRAGVARSLRPRARVALEVGPHVDMASFSGRGAQTMVGVMLRATVGLPWLQVAVGLAVLAPSDVDLGGGVGAHVSRLPLDLGVRATARLGAFELAGEVGFAATVLGIEGRNFAQPAKDSQLDFGVRVAVLLRHWPGARVGWFVGPVLALSARAFDLFADTLGVIATTPRVRVGAVLGVAIRLH